MKKLLYCMLLSGSTAFVAPASDKYTQVINQVEYDENGDVSLDKLMTVDKTGTASSPDNVVTGSTFTLWCINNENNHPTEIQIVNVDAYDPVAEITLLGITDPYVGSDGSRRTRADLPPYSVEYTVDGLITNDPTVQQAARMINLDTDINILPPETLIVPDGAESTNLHIFIDKNETSDLENTGLAHVSGSATGLITYTASSLNDGTIQGSILGSKVKVYTFLTPTGKIDLPEDLSSFRSVPDIPLTITNSYPGSQNCLRIVRLATGEEFDINFSSWSNSFGHSKDNSWIVKGEDLREHLAFTGAALDETFRIKFIAKTSFDEITLDTKGDLDPQEAIYIRGLITSAE